MWFQLAGTLGKAARLGPSSRSATELALWRSLLHLIPRTTVGFGDYGVVYPFESDAGEFIRAPSRVRLCGTAEHIIYRARPDEYRRLRAVALQDKSLTRFPDCWGFEHLHGCAFGGTRPGNATDWVARDTNLHLETTVRMVEQEIARSNWASGLDFLQPEIRPWLQDRLDFGTTRK